MGDPGLHSKFVEIQIEDAQTGKSTQGVDGLSPAHLERQESIRLARARTLAQLEKAKNPRYRKLLKRTLKALDAEII